MADATIDQVPVEGEELLQEESFSERLMDWVRSDLIWYAGSFTVHLLLLSLVLLLPTAIPATQSDTPLLESKAQDEDKKEPQKFDDFKLPDSPDTPPKELIVDPNVQPLKQDVQEAEINDKSEIYQHKGHGELQSANAPVSGAGAVGIGEGPKLNGHLGLGAQKGDPNGSGFGNRGSGQRKRAVALGGGTQLTERRDCRADLAGQPPKLRQRQLESAEVHRTVQARRQELHRARHVSPLGRRGRHRDGAASLPCRRPDPQVQGAL